MFAVIVVMAKVVARIVLKLPAIDGTGLAVSPVSVQCAMVLERLQPALGIELPIKAQY